MVFREPVVVVKVSGAWRRVRDVWAKSGWCASRREWLDGVVAVDASVQRSVGRYRSL